jgi:GDP-D-mannose dehydratase
MSKAKNKLNWSPKTTFEDMIKAMVNADVERYGK